MAILLKTTPVRLSSIQIMQVRVQTRVKEFGKIDTMETYHLPRIVDMLSSEIYYYCSLVDYAIDLSKCET